MNPLIYTTAFGPYARRYARACVRSIRLAGYRNPFFVMTDAPSPAIKAEGAEVMVADLEKIPEPTKKLNPNWRTWMARYHFRLDANGCDLVTYVHNDCLAIETHYLDQLDDALFVRGAHFAQEAHPIEHRKHGDVWTGCAMPADVRARFASNQAVNGAVWSIDTDRFDEFCHGVWTIFQNTDGATDQPALNAFLYEFSEAFPWQFYPLHVVSAASQDEKSILKSWRGRHLQLAEEILRRYPDMKEAEA